MAEDVRPAPDPYDSLWELTLDALVASGDRAWALDVPDGLRAEFVPGAAPAAGAVVLSREPEREPGPA